MNFRYARHTNNIEALIGFYTRIVGLDILGEFKNHSDYDGVFLGFKHTDWHLEFTTSKDIAVHQGDEDDLLVFYYNTVLERDLVVKAGLNEGNTIMKSKNPYWQEHGIAFRDPDGFGVVLTVKSPVLLADDRITKEIRAKGISDWDTLVNYIRRLPYGRNANRMDFELVLQEEKGTCSSKHALLKHIADLNGIKNVKLILGIYKMNSSNTPKIGDALSKHGLDYLPEAHCYLRSDYLRLDITSPAAAFEKIKDDILMELEIEPEQVNDFKVQFHKDYIRKWMKEEAPDYDFEKLWLIRETCIQRLSL